MVFLFHLDAVCPKAKISVNGNIFEHGIFGVHVFFIISGFVIPYGLYKDQYSPRDFFRYLWRRAIRLCPPAWIVLVFAVVLYAGIDFLKTGGINHGFSISLGKLLHNLLFTVPYVHESWVVGVFWTLAIEWQYYLFIGLAFPLLAGNKVASLSLILLSSCSYFLMGVFETIHVFRYIDFFLLGIVLFLHFVDNLNRQELMLMMALLVALIYLRHGPVGASLGLAAALLIAFFRVSFFIGDFLGRISYSLYLTHALVAGLLDYLFYLLVRPQSLGAKVLSLLFCVGGGIAVAALFNKHIENRFIAMSRNFRVHRDGN